MSAAQHTLSVPADLIPPDPTSPEPMQMLSTTLATAGGTWLEEMIFRGPGLTDAANHTVGLFMMILGFSTFFFVLLVGLSAYWAIKYRRRPGVPAPRSPSHNTPLEIFWTVVPSSALIVIFLVGFWGYMDQLVPDGDAITLDVTGKKWAWGVTYPNGAQSQWSEHLDDIKVGADPQTQQDIRAKNVTPYPVFVVPEGTSIRLKMSSQDVIHSFWIPDFKVKMDVFPNRYTGYGFTTPMLGENAETREIDGRTYRVSDHWIFCAEYCGDNHGEMLAILRVVSRADYDYVLTNAWTTDMPPVELGQIIAEQQCFTCHSTDGRTLVGPTWQNAWGYPVEFAGGGSLDLSDEFAWENYVRESIIDPQAAIHAGFSGQMPSFAGSLNETQVNALIAYIASLSDRGQAYAEQANAAYEQGQSDEGGEDGAGAEAPADGATPEQNPDQPQPAGEPAPGGEQAPPAPTEG